MPTARRSRSTKSAARKSTARKSTARKSTARKSTARKSTARSRLPGSRQRGSRPHGSRPRASRRRAKSAASQARGRGRSAPRSRAHGADHRRLGGLTRDRAQEVVDEVVTRAERTAERGRGRERPGPRALHDLRQMTGDEMKDLRAAIERLANRSRAWSRGSSPQPASADRAAARRRRSAAARRVSRRPRQAVAARSGPARGSRGGEEDDGAEGGRRQEGVDRRELAQPNAVDQARDRRQPQALGLLAQRSRSYRWAGAS